MSVDVLTSADIREAIDKILWGKSFVDVLDENSIQHTFILRSLTIKESNFSQYIYNREYDVAVANGVLTDEQLAQILEEDRIWGKPQEEELENLGKGKKILQAAIKDSEFFTAKKKKLMAKLEELRDRERQLVKTKTELFNLTAETRAEEVQRRYIVMLSTEDLDEQSYWTNEQEFMECSDVVLLYNLAIAYYRHNCYSEKELRIIARHPEWRYRWAASKSGDGLFGRPISEWSEMQKMLVYWSQYYDSIYESYEKPSDIIIENDEALDAWVREQNKTRSAGTQNQDKNIFGHKKAKTTKNHQEQFIMVAKGDNEAIEKVQNMNSERTRERLRREREIIEKKGGRIKEWDLRKGRHAR